jgi:hypothetical protein
MNKIEDRNKLKAIVESIDKKLTEEGYVFTPRHFDVTIDALTEFGLVKQEDYDKLKQQADILAEALRELAEFQNGAPLVRYEKEYNETMDKVWQTLNEYEK